MNFLRGNIKSIADANSARPAALCYKAFARFGGFVNAERHAPLHAAIRALPDFRGAAEDGCSG
jgi:hypothetical protein